MAGKTKPMSQIKQLLILHGQGHGKKAIARILRISKNTVKSYLSKLEFILGEEKGAFTIEDLIGLDDPVLEARFHAGNPSYKEEDRYVELKNNFPYYEKELKRRGVTRYLLWEEYRDQHQNGYSYAQFCFHLDQYKKACSPSLVLSHQPGEKLYVDFTGKTIHYVDQNTGELVECQIFAACLPYSGYSFAMALPDQSVEQFLYALSCCLNFFCGVPLALVPDNLKSAVITPNRYEPKLNQALEDFANHYGMSVVPARVRKPKDKAAVEGLVNLIYTRVFAKLRNITFFDISTLNTAISNKVREHNQTRMQQKPWCREERFLAEEKNHLQALPTEKFELKYYTRLTVSSNGHVYLGRDKHYYSVPYSLIGQRVKVIYTRSMVYIYHKGQQAAVHRRGRQQGSYTTVRDHLSSQHGHFLDRSPDYYMKQGSRISPALHDLMQALFSQDKYPEILYRSCDGLLSLGRKANPEAFEKACQVALENGVYSYSFIKNYLENRMDAAPDKSPPKSLPKHSNIRGTDYYN